MWLLFLWGPQTVWFVILQLENTAHKFGGGMCDMVKLTPPLLTIYTFGFIVNNSFLYLPKLLIIFVKLVHTFKYVFNRIYCISQWYFCCVSHDSSLYSCRNSYFYFLMIYVWPIHLLIKSSLCVGDLYFHYTLRGDPHLGDLHL